MSLLTISRVLALCLFINEAIVVMRTSPEERKRIVLPPFPALLLLLLLPFFLAIELPDWLAGLVILCQAVGLVIEVSTEIQLSHAKSFGVIADKATQPQTSGFYRWFEHPIYMGIMLQIIAWSVWMPLALLAVGANFIAVRQMVRNERAYLAEALNFSHQGLDTRLWN